MVTPPFWSTFTFFSRAVRLLGFLGFFGVRQGYSCVDVDRQDDYSADSSAQPCAVQLWWRFFPDFRASFGSS